MKYIGKYLSGEILLARECRYVRNVLNGQTHWYKKKFFSTST
jgi:hypothetical protein